MLASFLDKPYNKIQINRLLKEKNNTKQLILNPAEVLEKTQDHFQNQFRARQFKHKVFTKNWKEFYKPKKSIQANWYEEVNQSISEEEWAEMLAELKKNTAPGISGITYTLLQAAGPRVQDLFRTFAEICIKTGMVPLKWKVSQIYPIPKETDWQYNLSNVRPIALLETLRKCMTKILTKRLTNVFNKKDILKG